MTVGEGGVYPGCGWVGAWEGYTGVLPTDPPGPHIQSLLALGPYPRPNEGNLRLFDEVPEIGSRKGHKRVPE